MCGGCWKRSWGGGTLRTSLSGIFLQKKDVVNQCLGGGWPESCYIVTVRQCSWNVESQT